MLKSLGVVAAIIVVGLGAVLAFAATRPDTFRVQRTASINAPPGKIFEIINDFHTWRSWSPYETMDPTMQRTLSGAPSGEGAVYAWEGTGKAGRGRMEIVEAAPPSRVTIRLDLLAPFEAHNIVDFTLDDRGGPTDVTWAMHGPSPFVAKVMGLVFSMDGIVGKDFETGLANLKVLAER